MNDGAFGPPAHPLLGILPDFQEDPLRFLAQCQRFPNVAWLRYGVVGDIFQRRWKSSGCLLNDPNDIHHVLSSNSHHYVKTGIPPSEHRVFQKGLLHSDAPLHRQRRHMLLPCFHPQHFDRFGRIIVQETVRWVEGLPHGEVVEITQAMTQLTLRIIGRVLLGRDVSRDAGALSHAITVAQHRIAIQYRSLGALLLPLWVPTPSNRSFSQALTTLDAWVMGEIQTRRRSGRVQDDVLSHLLDAKTEEGAPLPDDAIRDELMTLFLAGHETTANALAWLWYVFTRHPDVETCVHDELWTVLKGRLPTSADVPQLRYCKSVFQEVLRVYPPAWILHLRKALQPDALPSGTHISKGTEIWISPFVTQRNPRLFSHPDRFDPHRFHSREGKRNPHAGFLPFGAGPRRCVGEGFAMLEATLIMATVLTLLKIEALPNHDIRPDPLMTLRMNGAFVVKAMKRAGGI